MVLEVYALSSTSRSHAPTLRHPESAQQTSRRSWYFKSDCPSYQRYYTDCFNCHKSQTTELQKPYRIPTGERENGGARNGNYQIKESEVENDVFHQIAHKSSKPVHQLVPEITEYQKGEARQKWQKGKCRVRIQTRNQQYQKWHVSDARRSWHEKRQCEPWWKKLVGHLR